MVPLATVHRRLAALAGVLLIVLVSSGVVPGVAPEPARACSCVALPVERLVPQAEVVVRGRVTKVERPVVAWSSGQPVTYSIAVSRVWRGPADGEPLAVATAASSASCGLEGLEVGHDVVIAASVQDGRLTTNMCNGSGPATPDRVDGVIAALGSGQEVVPRPGRKVLPPRTNGFVWPVAIGVTAVGLAAMSAAVAVAIRARRHTPS